MSDAPLTAPESPFSLLEPGESDVWFAYMRLQLRLRYEMNRQLRAESGISLADFDVLLALTSGESGRMQVSKLAERIGWERSRVSHHSRRMAARGLVTTAPSPTDGRATDVILTASGRAALADASPGHVKLIRTMFFADVSVDVMTELARTLSAIYENVVAHSSLPGRVDQP